MLAFGMGTCLPGKFLHFSTFDQSHGFCEKSCTTQKDAFMKQEELAIMSRFYV
jgi:hypothetical protein